MVDRDREASQVLRVNKVQWVPLAAEVNAEKPAGKVLKAVKDQLEILVPLDRLDLPVLQVKRVSVDKPVVMVTKASRDPEANRDP